MTTVFLQRRGVRGNYCCADERSAVKMDEFIKTTGKHGGSFTFLQKQISMGADQKQEGF